MTTGRINQVTKKKKKKRQEEKKRERLKGGISPLFYLSPFYFSSPLSPLFFRILALETSFSPGVRKPLSSSLSQQPLPSQKRERMGGERGGEDSLSSSLEKIKSFFPFSKRFFFNIQLRKIKKSPSSIKKKIIGDEHNIRKERQEIERSQKNLSLSLLSPLLFCPFHRTICLLCLRFSVSPLGRIMQRIKLLTSFVFLLFIHLDVLSPS